jgi:hypothetical protein
MIHARATAKYRRAAARIGEITLGIDHVVRDVGISWESFGQIGRLELLLA